jgi:hypothetical protein
MASADRVHQLKIPYHCQASRTWEALQKLPERFDVPIVAALSAAIILFAHFQAFTNPYVINDDVRQQVFWMQQWSDPELYQSDWISDYARHYVPWGVQGIYWLASRIIDPIYFSKVLTGFIFIFLSLSFFKVGKVIGGRQLAWIAVGVSWLMPIFLDNLSGGLSRSFASPLLIVFLLNWLNRNTWGVGAVLILQALLIPYIFILCGLAACLGWTLWRTRLGETPPFLARFPHFACLALGAVLVLLMNHSINQAGYGPLVTYGEMLGHPEFTEAGRYEILPVPSLLWEACAVPIGYMGLFLECGIPVGATSFFAILAICFMGGLRREWKPLTRRLQPFLCVGLASLLLYLAARIVLLKLFIPARYISYTVNIFFCLIAALCFQGLLGNRSFSKLTIAIAITLMAILGGLRLQGVGIFDYSEDKDLYNYILANTPKDAVIAGHPNLMDNVITFGRRKVFASYELAHPWCKGYWQRLRPRLEALFEAYYAEDADCVVRFSQKHNVDFLVVDDRHFAPDFLRAQPFFEPFGKMIKQQVGDRTGFILQSHGIFEEMRVNDHVRVIDLRPYRQRDSDFSATPLIYTQWPFSA